MYQQKEITVPNGKERIVKYMGKVYLSRWIAGAIALLAFGGILIMQRTVFTVTLGASQSVLLVSVLFTGIAYCLSWVISMCWKSNRDTMIHEMGNVELKLMKGVIEQAIAEREKE